MNTGESLRLEDVAQQSTRVSLTGLTTTDYSFRVFQRHFRGDSCLELGPAEGIMTSHLATRFKELTVVEGSESFAKLLKSNHPTAVVHHKLIENFSPAVAYDNIILGHVLEHVASPMEILQRVRTWLSPNGCVLAAVPNARSIHRQAAVIMGLLPTEHSLSEADHDHGHRRLYDPESFRAEFLGAGFRIDHFGGYWLKPLANSQIERDWTPEMLEAFMQLGERYPDIAGEIYIVASDLGPERSVAR